MSKIRFLVPLLCGVAPIWAAEIPDPAGLGAEIRRLAERAGTSVSIDVIGRSAGDLPIYAFSIPADASESTRQLYLIGGLDGDRPADALVAWSALRQAVEESPPLPQDVQLRFIPVGNPDGLDRWLRSPLDPQPGNAGPLDEDRDWIADEDGPDDIDDDGKIVWMRVRHPDGKHLADAAEPRLLRSADPEKGEVGEYLLLREGLDEDNDGQVNEDGPGGASPARNFAHGFREHANASGRFPLELPESRAIADDLIAHPRTALVVVVSEFDNVTVEPDSGRAPGGFPRKPATKLNPDDLRAHEILSEALREAADLEKGKGKASYPSGDVTGYAYFQLGVAALSHPIVSLAPEKPEKSDEPEPPKTEDEPAKKNDEADKEKKPEVDSTLKDDARWLARADAAGSGFVPWHTVDHPTHGTVEVGGFVPGFRELPGAAASAEAGSRLRRFLGNAAGLLPRVVISSLREEKRGGGVYRLEAVIRNDGSLPLVMRQGVTNRHVLATWATLTIDGGTFLSGAPRRSRSTLDPGESWTLEWFVTGEKGRRVTLDVTSTLGGNARRIHSLDSRRESF